MLGGNRWRYAASELLFAVLLLEQVEFECFFEGRARAEAADLERDCVPDGCMFCNEVFRIIWDVLTTPNPSWPSSRSSTSPASTSTGYVLKCTLSSSPASHSTAEHNHNYTPVSTIHNHATRYATAKHQYTPDENIQPSGT